MCVLSTATFAQKLFVVKNNQAFDAKLENALRYDYSVVERQDADYVIEPFFKGAYSLGKGFQGYYKVFDKNGKEIYRSPEWKAGGTGNVAENYIVKKIERDFKKFIPKG